MSTTQRYQHAKTLLVGEYTPELARHFPELILLAPGAKPRAYAPIEQSAIDALHAEALELDAELEADPTTPDAAPADAAPRRTLFNPKAK